MRSTCWLLIVLTTWSLANAVEAGEGTLELKPPLPNSTPFVVKKRLPGVYTARSKLKDECPLDGIGVRDNWSKDVGAKTWGAPDDVSLAAFTDEPVAYGKQLGFALRLINRTNKPAQFQGTDSRLHLVQEALDENGRWREIEDSPTTSCGNSYHQVYLEASRYWEFAARTYTGPFKTKIRFRLDPDGAYGNAKSIYSKEFAGQINKEQIRKGPGRRDIGRAFTSKDAREETVMETLIALIGEPKEKEEGRDLSFVHAQRALEQLAAFGPAAKDALPALRTAVKVKNGELRASAAYAIWRVDGNADICVKTLIGMLEDPHERESYDHVAVLFWHMGPTAKDAVPSLCKAMDWRNAHSVERTCGALGAIRAHADLAVPVLVKVLQDKSLEYARQRAVVALAEFGVAAKPAVPHLLVALKDEDVQVKIGAAFALWQIDRNADLAIPVLVQALSGKHGGRAVEAAAKALGKIGPPAKSAVPGLAKVMKFNSHALRISAGGAFWRITKETEPTVTAMIEVLQEEKTLDHYYVRDGLAILEEMGPRAKAAVPALCAALLRPDEYDDVRELLEKGLRKIDPEGGS